MKLEDVAQAIADRAEGRRRFLVAIAGPPASGKSTLAARLARKIGEGSKVVAMDGFHRDNHWLDAHGLRDRKGAPETFDVKAFTALVGTLASGEAADVPGFDRDRDCGVPAADHVGAADRILLVEGNYLLLDRPEWHDLARLWDVTVFLSVPRAELERRLVARWRQHGWDDDVARAWIDGNDLPNISTVLTESRAADYVIESD